MSTHTLHSEINEVYFCTLTCYKWKSLFEEAVAYESVYKWFRFLKKDECYILGYVIMPNHLHCLLLPTNAEKPLNKLVGGGKRFMAYDIVKNLKINDKWDILRSLEAGVKDNERKKGKKHQVFRMSFDARKCFDEKMILQKLDYIHHNPVKGKWSLAGDFTKYLHSSAAYYELGEENEFVTHFKEVNID